MHIAWDDLQLFLAVAETKSVSAAAKRLRVTQPTASRRLSQLEASLGERLFVRSAVGVAVTPFAERMLEPAQRMADCAGEIDRAVDRGNAVPAGVVRITAPPGVAYDLLAPFAAALRTELPDVRLEIVSSVRYVDLVRREADLALRQTPGTKELVTLGTVTSGVGVFAAPSYARTLPPAPTFRDIAWIGWAPPLDHMAPNPELAKRIEGFAPAFASDDFIVQLRAAEAGLGAIFLPRVRHRFSRTALVELELDVPFRTSTHLVCARTALDIPRVRIVADALLRELRHAREPKRSTKKPLRP